MTDDVKPANVCVNLIKEMRSLQLSTIGEDSIPHCGYTPYLHRAPNSFYIFVSQLAAHTRNLLEKKSVAIMIIADEQSTSQIFARARVNYLCTAKQILSGTPDYEDVLDEYQQRHGKMAGLLRQLPDFMLFELQPQSGQFVMGFGQAYALTGNDLSVFEHTRTG
ncbi:MAG: HugZ family protein [Nitrospirales bacterium]